MAKRHLYRKIEKIEAKESTGSYGAWRREFCGKYRELLIQARDNNYNSLLKTFTSKGKAISCRKKCSYCCFHYVAAPLAHGIVIVDYLYGRKGVLKQFIDNYKKWRHKGYDISSKNDHIRNQAFGASMPIDEIIEVTRPLSMRYLEMEIPCPFLANNTCLIYDVRPFPCSGQYSASPPHWCDPATEKNAEIYQLVPNDEDLMEMLQLAGPQLMLYEVTLPTMIYELLTKGVSAFESSAKLNI